MGVALLRAIHEIFEEWEADATGTMVALQTPTAAQKSARMDGWFGGTALKRPSCGSSNEEVFSPETVAYVSRKVNEALARRADPPNVARKKREAELAKARVELENIKSAIRQGIIRPSTKDTLEAAERHVAELEAPLQVLPVEGKIAVLPSLVEMYLNDLRGSLGDDTERARALVAKLIGRVTLRRNGQRLVAELQGNLSGLLELDDQPLYRGGSGARFASYLRSPRQSATWAE